MLHKPYIWVMKITPAFATVSIAQAPTLDQAAADLKSSIRMTAAEKQSVFAKIMARVSLDKKV